MNFGRGIAACVFAAGVLLSACGKKEAENTQANAPVVGVLTIEEKEAPEYKTLAAVLTNRDVGDARARISGVLERVLVKEGDNVKRGQLLAVIADQSLRLQAQAGAAAAERAQADYKRTQFLVERGVYSQAKLDAAKAEALAASAQAGAMRAMSAQGRIYAPANGKVTHLPIPKGGVVMPGDLVVAISTGVRVLRIELPEADAGALAPGKEVRILTADGDKETMRVAKIRQVYPAVENGRVTADLDAAGLEAKFVGERVSVLAPVGMRRTIVVPQAYIATRFGVDYVRLVQKDGVIDAPVQRGAFMPSDSVPDGIEILSGVRTGDRIAKQDAGT